MFWNYNNQDFVFDIWPEAADIDPATYAAFMQSANELCVSFAPVLPLGQALPERWKIAEVWQARHMWSVSSGGNRQEYGTDGLSIPTYPLIFEVRDLLRPKTSAISRIR